MSEPVKPPPGRGAAFARLMLPLAVVVALGAAVAWWLRPPASRAVTTPGISPTTETPAPSVVPPPAASSTPSRPASKPPRVGKGSEAASAPSAVPVAKPTLHVSSDVDGAHVFVDRQYIGTTPLITTDVSPGHHAVNVSAEGYDGVSETVEVGASGRTDLHVALKAVRLNASVTVVHKHAIGSCEGTLRADPAGIRYETSNASDRFAMPFGDLEGFTVDYAKKTLRVKRREGRTWNFTTKAATADPLLSFQHEVDRAREKLAAGK